MRVIRTSSVAAALLLAACAQTPKDTSLVTNSNPTEATPKDNSALREQLKAHHKAHIACVLKAAQGLALQPENPAHIAIAANQRCARTERAVQDAALLAHGAQGAYVYMKVARQTVQEAAIGLIVQTRAAVRRQPVSKPAPARGDSI